MRRERRQEEKEFEAQYAERLKKFEGRIFVPQTREEKRVEVLTEVLQPRVATDHEFLLDLHEVLIEAMFLRGRKSPFDRIQFIETGGGCDTFETDL